MKTGAIDPDKPFEGKHILITGGTGSLGQVLTQRLLGGQHGKTASITIFSRDEAKQHHMRLALHNLEVASEDIIYKESSENLHFRIGDVRDFSSIAEALQGKDIVFNAAALKQVPTCEYYPSEAVKTNIGGPINLTSAIEMMKLPVEAVIGISTDKACKPVNTMGMTKAIQERVFIGANLRSLDTRFVCARYGNVLASRGSVIPLFHRQIKEGGPVTLTVPEMTRFLLSLEQAVDTIIAAYCHGEPGDTFIPRVPAANMLDLAKALIGDRDIEIDVIGIRPGEKIHEILVAVDEAHRTIEKQNYYVIRPALPELRKEQITPALSNEYSSASAVVPPEGVARILADNGLRIEDEPDFESMYGF